MPPNSHFSADLVKTEEIFNGKLHFSCLMSKNKVQFKYEDVTTHVTTHVHLVLKPKVHKVHQLW